MQQMCDQVQCWYLSTMKVKIIDPIPNGGFTSFACFYSDRSIYCLGGNIKGHLTGDRVFRLDIYSMKWQELPKMLQKRANCGSFVKGDYLYALGGFCLAGPHS